MPIKILPMLSITWAGETLTLLHDKAIHWPRRHALILADPHFGKTDHFRQAGIPVPTGVTAHNLQRLDQLIHATQPRQLYILGDLFHARAGVTDAIIHTLRQWRARHADLRITVIAGNHDRHAGPPPAELDMQSLDHPLIDGRLVLRHEPVPHENHHVIAGHIHPAVRLSPLRKGTRGLRAPCFHFTPHIATLPAFGTFTGTHTIRPQPHDRIFAVGPNQILEVTPRQTTP